MTGQVIILSRPNFSRHTRKKDKIDTNKRNQHPIPVLNGSWLTLSLRSPLRLAVSLKVLAKPTYSTTCAKKVTTFGGGEGLRYSSLTSRSAARQNASIRKQ